MVDPSEQLRAGDGVMVDDGGIVVVPKLVESEGPVGDAVCWGKADTARADDRKMRRDRAENMLDRFNDVACSLRISFWTEEKFNSGECRGRYI